MKLANKVGFFYMLFQTYSASYVKCWLDGSDEYTILSQDDIRKLADSEGVDTPIQIRFNQAFTCDSLFLWDVEAHQIIQIHANQIDTGPNLEKKEFKPMTNLYTTMPNFNPVTSDFSKGIISMDLGMSDIF